jgi:hypothetical protein
VPANPANNAIIKAMQVFCHERMITSFASYTDPSDAMRPAGRPVRHSCQAAQVLRIQAVVGSARGGTAARFVASGQRPGREVSQSPESLTDFDLPIGDTIAYPLQGSSGEQQNNGDPVKRRTPRVTHDARPVSACDRSAAR